MAAGESAFFTSSLLAPFRTCLVLFLLALLDAADRTRLAE